MAIKRSRPSRVKELPTASPGNELLLRFDPSSEPVMRLALLDTLNPGGGRNRRQWPNCRDRLVAMFDGLADDQTSGVADP